MLQHFSGKDSLMYFHIKLANGRVQKKGSLNFAIYMQRNNFNK